MGWENEPKSLEPVDGSRSERLSDFMAPFPVKVPGLKGAGISESFGARIA
jgi:hypothetical protein